MDDKAEEDYLLQFPTFEDARFFDDTNPISSDDSEGESGQLGRLDKFNGWEKLNLKAKYIYTLLKQLKQKTRPSIWTTYKVPIPQDCKDSLLRPLSPNSMAKIRKSQQHQDDSVSRDESNSENINVRRTSNGLTNTMLNRHKADKRKREETAENEGEHHQRKIAKITSRTYVGLNKSSHILTSDEGGESDTNTSRVEQRYRPNNTNSATGSVVSGNSYVNGQESDSRRDRPSSSIRQHGNPNNSIGVNEVYINNRADDDFGSGGEDNSESEIEQSAQEVNRKSAVKSQPSSNTQLKTQGGSTSTEEVLRERTFTQQDDDEIAKFSSLLDEDLVENNHMWILQCPSSIDCSGLKGQKIDFSGCCKLDVGHRSYEAFSHRSQDGRVATLAVPSIRNQLQLMRIPIAGNIIVEEFLDVTSDSSFSIAEAPKRVALPDNLRTRHPLFGKHYKKQLRMAKRMDSKSIKMEPPDVYSDQDSISRSSVLSDSVESPTKKKKKKSKHTLPETSICEVKASCSSFENTKKKKVKKEITTEYT